MRGAGQGRQRHHRGGHPCPAWRPAAHGGTGVPMSSDLNADYWDHVEADSAPRIGLDRTAIEDFNAFLAPKLQSILAANDMLDRSDILLAVDLSAGFRAYSAPLRSGYLIAHSV